MNKQTRILVILLATLAILAFVNPFYIVEEGEQAVVIRFGKIIGTETDAGLKFKVPFIETVGRYPKRILSWDGDAQRLPTVEQQFIWVDTTARWRIKDPTLFYSSVSTLSEALGRLDDIIDSAVRTVISASPLVETVRSTNLIIENAQKEETAIAEAIEGGRESVTMATREPFPSITSGRGAISDRVSALAAEPLQESFGIELIDVVIRQIRYSDDLTQSVYARMIADRNQIAQAHRSDGEGQRAEWLGKLEREKETILSTAYTQAEEIKGNADAEATRIYGEAYSLNPDFYTFWKSIESYKQTLPNLNKTLSTDMSYFRYLYSPEG